MQCKSLWIKASAKCINVNVNVTVNQLTGLYRSVSPSKWSSALDAEHYAEAASGRLPACECNGL